VSGAAVERYLIEYLTPSCQVLRSRIGVVTRFRQRALVSGHFHVPADFIPVALAKGCALAVLGVTVGRKIPCRDRGDRQSLVSRFTDTCHTCTSTKTFRVSESILIWLRIGTGGGLS
jgi:hypothetical protein